MLNRPGFEVSVSQGHMEHIFFDRYHAPVEKLYGDHGSKLRCLSSSHNACLPDCTNLCAVLYYPNSIILLLSYGSFLNGACGRWYYGYGSLKRVETITNQNVVQNKHGKIARAKNLNYMNFCRSYASTEIVTGLAVKCLCLLYKGNEVDDINVQQLRTIY